MRIEAGRDYLLFDGDCGICSHSANVARRIDRNHRFVIEPYQDFAEAELLAFGISFGDCTKELQVITRRGGVVSGAGAINYFLWQRFPGKLLVIVIWTVPLLPLVEMAAYALVARNRRRISLLLGLEVCSVTTVPAASASLQRHDVAHPNDP